MKLSDSPDESRESILFPSQENNDGKITGFALLKDYLIYSTDVITYFCNQEQLFDNLNYNIFIKDGIHMSFLR